MLRSVPPVMRTSFLVVRRLRRRSRPEPRARPLVIARQQETPAVHRRRLVEREGLLPGHCYSREDLGPRPRNVSLDLNEQQRAAVEGRVVQARVLPLVERGRAAADVLVGGGGGRGFRQVEGGEGQLHVVSGDDWRRPGAG